MTNTTEELKDKDFFNIVEDLGKMYKGVKVTGYFLPTNGETYKVIALKFENTLHITSEVPLFSYHIETNGKTSKKKYVLPEGRFEEITLQVSGENPTGIVKVLLFAGAHEHIDSDDKSQPEVSINPENQLLYSIATKILDIYKSGG